MRTPANSQFCLLVGAFLAAFGLLGGPYVHTAGAGERQPAAQMAAAGGGPNGFQHSTHGPVDGKGINSDMGLLLAQNEPAAKTAEASRGDTVLVAFPLSIPQDADEDIAKQHSLALVDRTVLHSFGLRVVRYRIEDGRPIEPLMADLRKDQRVRSVQVSVAYALPGRSEPATEVSRLKDRPDAVRQAKQGDAPLASVRRRPKRRTAAIARAAAKPAERGMVAAAAMPEAGRPGKRDRPLASVNQTALRFPTADEPFVNIGAERR